MHYIFLPLSTTTNKCGDFGFEYILTNNTWTLTEFANDRGVAFDYGFWNETINVTVNNSFYSGTIKVDNIDFSSGSTIYIESGSSHYYEAASSLIYSNKYYFFQNWSTNHTTNTVNLQISNSTTLTANFNPLCKLDLQNNFSPEIGNGILVVNNQTRTLPISDLYYSPNTSVNIQAPDQTVNYINFTFSQWSGGNTFNPRDFVINTNSQLTANYNAQPIIPEIVFGTIIGQPVHIAWTDNPNSNVTQYRIHRRVFQNGSWSSDIVIGTVNKGVQSFIDYDYNLGVWKEDILLEYGLTAYYIGNNSWSSGGANTRVYCTPGASMQSNNLAINEIEMEIPLELAISNFPNPFNPATTLNYQLPQDGMVTIKVYDVLGKEVATLVNEQKSAGYYKVDYDASKLTSGVYICSIQASNFNKSIKLLLTK